MTLWSRDRDVPIQGSVLVLGAAIAVACLVLGTGGSDSPYVSLLYVPVVLAVVRCSYESVVALGFALSIISFISLGRSAWLEGLLQHNVIQTLTLALTALIGATYARRIQNERLKLKHTVEEQETLLNASQIVNSADKLEHALNSSLLFLRTLVPNFRAAAIFLVDDSQRYLELRAVTGIEPSEMKFQRFSMTDESNGWTPESAYPLSITDTATARDLFVAGLDPNAGSIVCLSLRSLKVPIGMLFVSSERAGDFDASQMRMLQAFSDRIGFPLQRVRIQEGLQGMAYTDGMTGLYNFRAFRTHLTDEMKRSVRYGRPLSLIILDLDEFKAINDRYGHPAGDQLLTGVANIVRSTVRATDLPVRYGGEEFAVICPETEAAEALVVAERIRTEVEAARFKLVQDETCAITISAGVATYPDHANDEVRLLSLADTALYQAKRTGKNRVEGASATPPAP